MQFTRAAALWSALIVGFVILILLLVFIMQNTDSVTVNFFGMEVESAHRRRDTVGRGRGRPADRGRRDRAHRAAPPSGEAESEGRPLAR